MNLKKDYLEELKNIDWQDTKKAAYNITHYGRLLATDEKKKELFSELELLLEKYKYKKSVEKVDENTRDKYNQYVQVADE